MAGPDSSGQSEAGLTAEDIKYLLGLPKTSFMRGSDCEIELILNLAALFRLAGTSLSRALRSRYGADDLLNVGHRVAIYAPWYAFPKWDQPAFFLIDHLRFSRDQFGTDFGISRERLSTLQNGSGRDSVRASMSSLELVLEVLERDGVLADMPSLDSSIRSAATDAPVVQEDSSEKGEGPSAILLAVLADIVAEEQFLVAQV